jgi:nitroimidazol reductase NimA-like FMN-containing flavoprotein (pyridoxamine 5'-phosphate oxidase superfamily)
MDDRFRDHDLTAEEVLTLLDEESIGIFATINEDGTPHSVPMHYLLIDGRIYMQSRPTGRKIANVRRNPVCSLAVVDMHLHTGEDCHCAGFRSAVFKGNGRMLDDEAEKMEALRRIYLKQGKDREVTPERVSKLGIIEITAAAVTGRHRDIL